MTSVDRKTTFLFTKNRHHSMESCKQRDYRSIFSLRNPWKLRSYLDSNPVHEKGTACSLLFFSNRPENRKENKPKDENDIMSLEQMKKLELALSKKHFYQIIVHVVGKDSENLIRFLTAFEDWKTIKSKRERKQKGRKIVSMFISSGSQYEISGVPEWNMKDMISSEFDESSSELAKEFALRQLIKDPIVMSTLDFEFLSSQEGENDDCGSRGSNSRESIDEWVHFCFLGNV